MLWTLIKKQMQEVFRSYFYNQKKNQARSKAGVVAWFIFFGFIMIGVLGGTFTGLAFSLSIGLVPVGMGWLYHVIMCGIAITLGAFGSVFNTYAGLFLPKDNDLLLSMPIPVSKIIIARLVNVYLLGLMYSGVVSIPTVIVYWVIAGLTPINLLCGILLVLIVSFIVLIISCLLGWVVAKISLKLKNKSFITVFISIAFIAGYYFVYFKAREMISDLIENALIYGESIKKSAYPLYLFGSVGEGDVIATLVFLLITVVLLALVMFMLSRNFLKIVSASGVTSKVRYKEKKAKQKTVFGALLGKEISRFITNPNYMLNCGLGILLIPAMGIFLLVQGANIIEMLNTVFIFRNGGAQMFLCGMIMLVSTMNDISAPSVSLEGKSIWIPQSLPVNPANVLRAKTMLHVILTGIPMIFAVVCMALIADVSITATILLCVLPLAFTLFSALFGMFLGIKKPILNWTSEVVPIKQSGAVMIAIFGGWGFVAVITIPYFIIGLLISLEIYLAIWTVILLGLTVLLYRWLCTKGAKEFSMM